jgi:hypothetical protein
MDQKEQILKKEAGFMVDFSKIEEVTIPHMKGGEGYAKARDER